MVAAAPETVTPLPGAVMETVGGLVPEEDGSASILKRSEVRRATSPQGMPTLVPLSMRSLPVASARSCS